MCREFSKFYNSVNANDFDYYEKLGDGSFGTVVRCRRKSTGQLYAMKIQRKKMLLEHFDQNISSTLNEKCVQSICKHPFIVRLAYAFDGPGMAMLVMDYCLGLDLHEVLLRAPRRRLDHQNVQYYSAELISALVYMHKLGFIYRDLKPENVMLLDDGNIRTCPVRLSFTQQVFKPEAFEEGGLFDLCKCFHLRARSISSSTAI